jgi:hypothetical protein
LTRDQYRINGLFISERACRTVGGATASGSLAWNFQSTGYTGIVNSNQNLVVCDSKLQCADATVLVDSYCFHACPASSIGFQVMVHFPLHSSLISLLLEPLSVAH